MLCNGYEQTLPCVVAWWKEISQKEKGTDAGQAVRLGLEDQADHTLGLCLLSFLPLYKSTNIVSSKA